MSKEMQKKLLYILMVVGLIWLYVSYVPFIMDYYVQRPNESFFEFYQANVLNEFFDFETILLTMFLVVLFCLTWNGGVSVGVMSLALFMLTHGSYVKYVNRKEMLRLDDLLLTEAAGMAAGYLKFKPDRYLLTLVGGLLVFCVAGAGIEYVRRKWLLPVDKATKTEKKKIKLQLTKEEFAVAIARILVGTCTCVAISVYTEQFVLKQMSLENADAIDLVESENNCYVLYRFVKNDSIGSISAETIEDSYDFLLERDEVTVVSEAVVRPNVIVIMNESWWNTDNVDPEKVSFSMDPMAPFKELGETCITGHLTSNVYGGGTISSEAEFLTGLNTKYYVTTSTIYEKTLDRKLPSLVDYFNALNYETIAIHPYYGEFYSRDQVYQTMGFDEMIFDEDMVNQEIYSRYISDESLANEIIAEYEEQGDEDNKFIWSVSISNHRRSLDYHLDSIEDYDYPISVDLHGSELSEDDDSILVNYINGIYYAGESYQQLVDYFSKKEEPVILVMFGDHIPNFSLETLAALGLSRQLDGSVSQAQNINGSGGVVFIEDGFDKFGNPIADQTEDADAAEMLQKLYSVPVVMWSNFDLAEEQSFQGESIYYLPQMLLESAGLPDSEMTLMLKNQRKVFRANSREIVLDVNGERLTQCTEEQMEMLSHSKNIIYDVLFGEGVGEDIWVPLLKETESNS